MPPLLTLILLALSILCLIAEWTASSEQAAACRDCTYCKAKRKQLARPTHCYICRRGIPPHGTCPTCHTEYWKDD